MFLSFSFFSFSELSVVVGEDKGKIVTRWIEAWNLVNMSLGWPLEILEGVPKKISNRKWVIDEIQNGRRSYCQLIQSIPKYYQKCIQFGRHVPWVMMKDSREMHTKIFNRKWIIAEIQNGCLSGHWQLTQKTLTLNRKSIQFGHVPLVTLKDPRRSAQSQTGSELIK